MNDIGGWIDGRAHHHSVRVTNVIVSDADLEIASVKAAGLAPKPSHKSDCQVSLNCGMTSRAAGHGHRFDAIEFVAQFLPLLPFEEFGERHGLAHGEVHVGHCSTIFEGAFLSVRPDKRRRGHGGRPKPPRFEALRTECPCRRRADGGCLALPVHCPRRGSDLCSGARSARRQA